MSEMNWMNREKVIHERFFDTISRPLSSASKSTAPKDNTSSSPFNMFSGRKIKWNHFGKKYALRFSDYELEYADLYDALMKKIYEARLDFEGSLAFIDQYGRQVIITNDKDVRVAMQQSKGGKGPLKIHTTLREDVRDDLRDDREVIAAADMADAARGGRPARSQSVPPVRPYSERSYNTYPHRSPSSMDSAPETTYRHHYNRVASPPPPPSTTATFQNSPPLRTVGEIVKTNYSHRGSLAGYSGYPGAYGPYSQNVLYGMPPHNGMLWRFLASPFPFGHHQSRSFIGPNKYHHFGGYNSLYSAGFGPGW